MVGASRRGTASAGLDSRGHGRRRRRLGADRGGEGGGRPRRASRRWWRVPGGVWRERSSRPRSTRPSDQLETNFWGAVRVVQASAPGHAAPGRRPGGAGQLHRRDRRPPVPGVLQRQQVRPGGVRRGPGLRGGSLRHRGDAGRARQRAHRFHAEPARCGAARVGAAGRPDPYADTVAKAVGLMERDEQNGVPPGDVAASSPGSSRAVARRRRVSVGKPDERVGIIAKRLLPVAHRSSGRRRAAWGSDRGRCTCTRSADGLRCPGGPWRVEASEHFGRTHEKTKG